MLKFLLVLSLAAVCLAEMGILPMNVIDGPVQCPEGQQPDASGKCRPVWGRAMVAARPQPAYRNVIVVPPRCPDGQKPDQSGKCRPVFGFNLQEYLQKIGMLRNA